MINIALIILTISIILMGIDAVKNKAPLSKIVSVNCITSYIVVAIVLLSISDVNNYSYIDAALIYAALGFVASIAFLKYFTQRV